MTDAQIAHDNKRRKAEARDLVTSWVLALWAMGTGIYLMAGGGKHLVSPAYSYLLPLVGHNYHTVGLVLLAGGAMKFVGVATDQTLLLAAGAIVCTVWLGTVAVCMLFATLWVPGGENMNWTTSLGLSICFAIRAYNRIHPPRVIMVLAMILPFF